MRCQCGVNVKSGELRIKSYTVRFSFTAFEAAFGAFPAVSVGEGVPHPVYTPRYTPRVHRSHAGWARPATRVHGAAVLETAAPAMVKGLRFVMAPLN